MLKNKGVAVVEIILAIAFIAGIGAYVFTKKADSPIEQAAEAVIKIETGLDIDFSPEDKAQESK